MGARFPLCQCTLRQLPHRYSAIRFVTPQERHEGQDSAILKARTTTYEAAKAAHPDRWRTRPVRNWTPIGTVWLAQP